MTIIVVIALIGVKVLGPNRSSWSRRIRGHRDFENLPAIPVQSLGGAVSLAWCRWRLAQDAGTKSQPAVGEPTDARTSFGESVRGGIATTDASADAACYGQLTQHSTAIRAQDAGL